MRPHTNISLVSFTLIMSSSEENYDLDDISGDESEGYSPVSKKTVSTSHHFRYL